ncbi:MULTISPECIES: signal peptide peptidase SppA [unclassified Arcicella]|uniref:signal peptide peptidase SppA n=1 Tax=unclassified Arcicella TaxID=2644986 RepID=UPI002862FBC2|nr:MULTISPECIES: signal peptide peptidase SppA [unclassified Arcicella]MDR6564990.1 protease-4 [Arcicella sp. BE51]MDR6814803.1 protease-4 [Arcicella sp. BE140]MDR6826249.1 protease-4 [Arcicella sp. BE139]
MLQFLKYVLATIVGLIVFSIVSLFIIIGIAAAVGSSKAETTLKDNSVLKLDLNHSIVENVSDDENPFKDLGGAFMDNNESIGMVQIREALKRAAVDSHIKGIYLQAHYPQAGYAQLEEIRNALLDFKKSGKFIYSYGESFTEKGYYVTSVSDKIYLNPAGGMDFNGISAEVSFYKGALDKLDIKPVVFRVGEYKSAVEPYLRENMSDANKQQYSLLLNSINNHIFEQIAKSRNIDVATLKKVADELIAYKPKGALASKLVTDVGYYDEFEADFKKKLKKETEDKIDFVGLSKFLKAESAIPFNESQNKIAVIVGEGAIIGAKADKGNIGSDDWVAELRKAREDKKVKAIVLRIDSPGGSSLASDVMWREVELTKKVKPVIASMADYAASGGYYMAMAADTIVAEPTTITGSIGIFAQFFNFENFLKNKLGITNDRVNTNAHSDFPTVTREMTDFEKDWFQRSVDAGYETFTSKAAKGRKMTIEKLKSLAGGHVWSGIEAKANGLVDVLGGLDDAIKIAAKKAKLKDGDYKAKFYPQPKSFFEEVFEKKEEEAQAKIMKAQFGELAPYVKQIQDLKAREGIMALMPEVIEFK